MPTGPARAILAAVALFLLLVPPGSAAMTQPKSFTWDQPMMDGIAPDAGLTVVSGDLEAQLAGVQGNFGFFGAQGLVVKNLDRACWGNTPNQCATGTVSIVVEDGGDAGFGFPQPVDVRFTAEHALGLFVDFQGDEDLNSLDITRSLMAPAVEGQVEFTRLPPIASGLVMSQSLHGAAVGLSADSVIHVMSGLTTAHTATGKQTAILFSGTPHVDAFPAEMVVLPFEASSTARFTPATKAAAADGLELTRIQTLLSKLESSNQAVMTEATLSEEPDLGPLGPALHHVLNGAILRTYNEAQAGTIDEQFAFIRFRTVEVEGSAGEALTWSGKAMLDLQDGHVKGAQPTLGFSYLSMPWWSWALWVIGIGLVIAALVTKSPREVPRWENKRWIGRLCGAVAFVLTFVIWDFETRAVWGVSLLHGGMDALLPVAAIQLAPFGMAMFATAAPLRLIVRHGVRLAKQGSFMRLSGTIAAMVGIFLAVLLLRTELNLIAGQVIRQFG